MPPPVGRFRPRASNRWLPSPRFPTGSLRPVAGLLQRLVQFDLVEAPLAPQDRAVRADEVRRRDGVDAVGFTDLGALELVAPEADGELQAVVLDVLADGIRLVPDVDRDDLDPRSPQPGLDLVQVAEFGGARRARAGLEGHEHVLLRREHVLGLQRAPTEERNLEGRGWLPGRKEARLDIDRLN